jgi:hypothetical protein
LQNIGININLHPPIPTPSFRPNVQTTTLNTSSSVSINLLSPQKEQSVSFATPPRLSSAMELQGSDEALRFLKGV